MSKKNKQRNDLILKAMVAIGAVGGGLGPEKVDRICKIYERFTDEVIDEDQIHDLAKARANDETALHVLLSGVREELDLTTKETILKASYLTLMADGEVWAEEHKRIRDFARALRIEEVHFNAILEDLTDRP